MEERTDASGPESGAPDQNEMPWCAVDEEATLLLVSQDSLIQGRMVELGPGGCRMQVRRTPPTLPAAVETKFRVRGFPFRLGGKAESADGGKAVLVHFSPMSTRRRDDLMEALCEIEAEREAKAAAERASAGDSAQQGALAGPEESGPDRSQSLHPSLSVVPGSNRPKSWLRHLFSRKAENPSPESVGNGSEMSRPGARGPVLVARRSHDASTPSSSETMPAHLQAAVRERSERRSDPRCGVDTTAMIYLVKIGSKLTSQVLDLSLSGCRIRTTDGFPVGIYTRVETEFRIQGLSFRLGGVVQTIHDRHVVGIRFLDVSARKREQLAELIEEIASMRAAGIDGPRA